MITNEESFKNFSALWNGSDKHKKTVLMMFLLIPVVLTGYIAAFLCHYQCAVSDTHY